MKHFKYPRTPHLIYSPGASSDDIFLDSDDVFKGKEVVVSLKCDGESTAIYKDGIHARSLDSRFHPSRSYVNALYGRLKNELPPNMRLAGENLYACHSIKYSALPDWFLLFGIYVENDEVITSLSWDDVCAYAELLDLKVVPVLYRGLYDEELVRACYSGESKCGGVMEGFVVRLASSFRLEDFGVSVAKYVRKDHIQTDEHWMSKPIEVNGLKR